MPDSAVVHDTRCRVDAQAPGKAAFAADPARRGAPVGSQEMERDAIFNLNNGRVVPYSAGSHPRTEFVLSKPSP